MKLIWKPFLFSTSDNNAFKSDFVTLLSTPASSTTYESFGGPSFNTSNSDANAESEDTTGQKLRAKEIAIAANPCWTWETQLLGSEKDCFSVWECCFLRLQQIDLVDLGKWGRERKGFEREVLGLKRGEKGGERMVSIGRETITDQNLWENTEKSCFCCSVWHWLCVFCSYFGWFVLCYVVSPSLVVAESSSCMDNVFLSHGETQRAFWSFPFLQHVYNPSIKNCIYKLFGSFQLKIHYPLS